MVFNNIEVEADGVLGNVNQGLEVANYAIDYGRYCISWAALGVSQACLEAMIKYSKQRKQFGHRLYSFQLIQEFIANATTLIRVARCACCYVSYLREHRQRNYQEETNIVKYFTSNIANRIASDTLQLFGANGCCDEYSIERFFREARAFEIMDGSSQLLIQLISQYALRIRGIL